MRRHLRLITLLLFPTSLALAQDEPAAVAPQVVDLAPLEGFPGLIDLGQPDRDEAVRYNRLWIHHNGAIELSVAPPAEALGAPAALHGEMRTLIVPFWSVFDPPCPGRPARNRVAHDVRDAGLVVEWSNMTTGDTACANGAAEYAFALRLDVLDAQNAPVGENVDAAELLRITFTYARLPIGGAPRAGVVLAGTVLELLPDEGKPRTDRAPYLLAGNSEEGPNAEDPGVWVIEMGLDGTLVGDPDGDGIRAGDNCPDDANPGQENHEVLLIPGADQPVQDAEGDVCDDDDDNDGRDDVVDNCVWIPNFAQHDLDGDGRGDLCDWDRDGDGIFDAMDNCATEPNPGQFDMDLDARGDACDDDPDGDGVPTVFDGGRSGDTCPWVPDSLQRDSDGDGLGDACDARPKRWSDEEARVIDADADGDGWADIVDVCPYAADPRQGDQDGDGVGDLCDADADGDAVLDVHQGRCFSSPLGRLGRCPVRDGNGDVVSIPFDPENPERFRARAWAP